MRTTVVALLVALAAPTSVAAKGAGVATTPSYASSAVGKTNMFGAGLYLGRPSGVSVKYWFDTNLAVTGTFGSWLDPFNGALLSGGILYHMRDIAPGIKPFELGFHFGGAAGVGWLTELATHEHFDPFRHEHRHEQTRVLVFMQPIAGAHLLFREVPIEVFVEIAPAIRFNPGPAGLDPAGGVGGRYHV